MKAIRYSRLPENRGSGAVYVYEVAKLSSRQNRSIARLGGSASDQAQSDFDRAWVVLTDEIPKLEAALAKSTDPAKRTKPRNAIQTLWNSITPPAKQGAAKRWREIDKALSIHFRSYGVPKNIRHLYRYLCEKGLMHKGETSSGNPVPISEKSFRRHLKKVFAITGKPGRRPK